MLWIVISGCYSIVKYTYVKYSSVENRWITNSGSVLTKYVELWGNGCFSVYATYVWLNDWVTESHFVALVMALLSLLGFCGFDRGFFNHKTSGSVVKVKVKVSLEQVTKSQSGSRLYSSTLSLTSALVGGWLVNVTPRPLYPRERPGTHCIGCWVGPRAGQDGCGKSRPNRVSIRGPSSP